MANATMMTTKSIHDNHHNQTTRRRPLGGFVAALSLCILLVAHGVNLGNLRVRMNTLEKRLDDLSVQQHPRRNSLEGGPPITTTNSTTNSANNKAANALLSLARTESKEEEDALPSHHQTCATYGYPSARVSFPRAPINISPHPYCASLRENPATDIVCKDIFEKGHWEPGLTVSMILDLGWSLDKADFDRALFIDVGGNVGYFTSVVASLGHEGFDRVSQGVDSGEGGDGSRLSHGEFRIENGDAASSFLVTAGHLRLRF